jgi:hypothetical protein
MPMEERLKKSKVAKERGYGKWMIGKKRSESTKDKISKKNSIILKGRRLSPKSEFKKGKLHWNWKNGITPLIKKIRESKIYKQWHTTIFKRDNFTCQYCGLRNGNGIGKTIYLEAHHRKEFSVIINEHNIKTIEDAENCKELWDLNNGITLCKECHNKTKRGRNTLNK